MTSQLEKRKHRRVQADFRVTLGVFCSKLEARGVDASTHGIGVVLGEPLEPGQLVFVTLTEANLGGFTYVRHCSPLADGKFRLGLEFREKLQVGRTGL